MRYSSFVQQPFSRRAKGARRRWLVSSQEITVATIKERDFFADNILASIENNSKRLGDSQLTGYLSMKGNLYNSELMVIGRAVNGWTKGISPSELKSQISRKKYTDTVYNTVTYPDDCPMEWVTECWGEPTRLQHKKIKNIQNLTRCVWKVTMGKYLRLSF